MNTDTLCRMLDALLNEYDEESIEFNILCDIGSRLKEQQQELTGLRTRCRNAYSAIQFFVECADPQTKQEAERQLTEFFTNTKHQTP